MGGITVIGMQNEFKINNYELKSVVIFLFKYINVYGLCEVNEQPTTFCGPIL